MNGAISAGGAYFAIVFLCAFAIGTARVLLVAPWVGDTLAVTLEAPIVLAISWFATRLCVARCHVPSAIADRLLMGATAFTLLMLTETSVSAVAFHRTLQAQASALATPAGAIGLATQVAFALMPAAAWVVDANRTRP